MPKIKQRPLVIIRDSGNTLKAMEKLRVKIARLEAQNKALRKENEFLKNEILFRLESQKPAPISAPPPVRTPVLKNTLAAHTTPKEKEIEVVKGPAARPARKEEEYVDDRLARLSGAFVSRIARHDPFFYMDDDKK